LFTDKSTTTPLYKALSVDFQDRMLFGEVKSSVKEATEAFGVSRYPTLVVLNPQSGVVQYDGKLKHDALHEFLDEHAIAAPTKKKSSSGKSKDKEQAAPEPEETPCK
jgi:protein disulfide-isomerase A6